MGLPWLTFTLTALARGMISPGLYFLAYIVGAICLVHAVGWIFVGVSHFHPMRERRASVSAKCIGFLCLAALAAGWLVGILYDSAYMDEYWRLHQGATHKNVKANSLGLTDYSDAAVIEFAAGTFIDTDRAVGYMDQGEVYCVAPVTGTTFSDSPVYYAAGENCCHARSQFTCAKAEPAKGKILTAIVMKRDEDDSYLAAIRMAKSVYQLKGETKTRTPLKFVDDVETYVNELWHDAFICIVCIAVVESFICMLTGIVIRNLLRDPPLSFNYAGF